MNVIGGKNPLTFLLQNFSKISDNLAKVTFNKTANHTNTMNTHDDDDDDNNK